LKKLLKVPDLRLNSIEDRITRDTIILNGEGKFPKKVIIFDKYGEEREYRFIKTNKGGYLLT